MAEAMQAKGRLSRDVHFYRVIKERAAAAARRRNHGSRLKDKYLELTATQMKTVWLSYLMRDFLKKQVC
jgi:hypothetical protein